MSIGKENFSKISKLCKWQFFDRFFSNFAVFLIKMNCNMRITYWHAFGITFYLNFSINEDKKHHFKYVWPSKLVIHSNLVLLMLKNGRCKKSLRSVKKNTNLEKYVIIGKNKNVRLFENQFQRDGRFSFFDLD